MEGSYEYPLDIFGQQPGLQNLYTQISLIYGVPPIHDSDSGRSIGGDDPLVSTIHLRFTNALRRLTESIPWIAGQVIRTPNSHKDGKGTYKIVPLDSIPQFSIKDRRRRNEHPNLTMKALRDAHFPFSMLDENVIAPRNTLMAPGDVIPVFLVQATIIPSGESKDNDKGRNNGKEGLLLTFVGLHNVMDMTGLGWIIGLLDRLAKGGEITPGEMGLANVDRTRILEQQLLHVKLDIQVDAAEGSVGPKVHESGQQPPTPEPRWAYIAFSSSSLTEMKTQSVDPSVNTHRDSNPPTSFVSTDDVLSAFIFQSIVRARLPRFSTDAPVTFARAIDARRFLDINTSYPGVIQCMTYHTYTPQSMTRLPLGFLAADLRAALQPSSKQVTSPTTYTMSSILKTRDIAYRTRLLATLISRSSYSELSQISVTSSLDLTRDVMLSSWANQSALWTLDFRIGLGVGTPESVRRPAFMGVESLCYIMPRKTKNGEAVVGICLRDEDMERMKDDEHIKRWGRWIG